jgi:hypothetical protein
MPAISQLADPSIYANQPPAQPAMPLQDLVSLGRNNLAFQREKTLLPAQIEQGQAQSRTAVLTADTAKLDNSLKHIQSIVQNQQTLLTKPDLTSDDIINATKAQAQRMGTPESAVNQALAGIPVNGSPSELRAYLATNLAKTLGAQSQLEKMYPGGILPGQIPSTYQPSAPAETSAPVPAGVAPAGTVPAKAAPVEEFSKPEKLSYPVPVAGQPRAELPSEKGDRDFGEKARLGLTAMQQNYPAIRQNYDKLIDQTEKVAGNTLFGGAAGTAERTLKAKIGTPEYQQLSKDLANAQIAQIKAEGGSLDTVAGQSLAAHANGSVVYDPTVLIGIARRNAANLENKNAQANGLRIASEKFGDANAKHFMSMWSKNANDNAVFEMKYIFSRAKTPEEGIQQVQKYIKESGLSEAKRKELATKYLNLQKLETTGSL